MNKRPLSPWRKLPKRSPFVLKCDRKKIDAHNDKYKKHTRYKDHYEIKLKVVPEPFIGNPKAGLWLLNLNPGFEKSDEEHSSKTIAMQRRSLLLKAKNFWYIEPKYCEAAGYCWWRRVLHDPIAQFGAKQVQRNIFCVEFFPYHSKKYKWSGGLLPSQEFTLQLVEKAVKEGKRFIILRRKTWWLKKIKGLNVRHMHP